MTVLPIDVIARSDAFEVAAAGRELRPWEWTFIHAVDGRSPLREVADLCGLELEVATEIVSEQTEAGILRVVTMTLDGYRQWSGMEPEDVRAGAAAAPQTTAAAPAAPAVGPEDGEFPLPAGALDAEPFAVQPALPATSGEPDPFAFDAHDASVGEEFAPASFAPDPFAPDPFARELFTAEPFTPEPLASNPIESAGQVPSSLGETGTAGKGIAFSFDASDDFDRLDPEPRHAPAAPEGISLSFEPGELENDVPAPASPDAGGVSLSFEPETSPLDVGDARAAERQVPVAPEPLPADAADGPVNESGAPLDLAFSPDGFPILTPGPAAVGATVAAPALDAASSEPVRPQPGTEDQSDLVGSLIARVLSIRIK
jgi:hypothetical protein